jgi:hypothetical protein
VRRRPGLRGHRPARPGREVPHGAGKDPGRRVRRRSAAAGPAGHHRGAEPPGRGEGGLPRLHLALLVLGRLLGSHVPRDRPVRHQVAELPHLPGDLPGGAAPGGPAPAEVRPGHVIRGCR